MIRVSRQPGAGVRYVPAARAPLATSAAARSDFVGEGEMDDVLVREGEMEGEAVAVAESDEVGVGVSVGVTVAVRVDSVTLPVEDGVFEVEAGIDVVDEGVPVGICDGDNVELGDAPAEKVGVLDVVGVGESVGVGVADTAQSSSVNSPSAPSSRRSAPHVVAVVAVT